MEITYKTHNGQRKEIHLERGDPVTDVRIDGDGSPVTIENLFGPLCANSIRVALDRDTVEWVIEMEVDDCDENGIPPDGSDAVLFEVARIDAELKLGEFKKPEPWESDPMHYLSDSDLDAINSLLGAAMAAQCSCSISERDSGHKVGCWRPALQTAIDNMLLVKKPPA